MWRFIDAGLIDGYFSAALFESIGHHVGSGKSAETVLFWRTKTPVVYIGYHQCVNEEVFPDFCKSSGISIVRRILGGGCGFCDENQILYSVIGNEKGVIPGDIHAAYEKVLGGVVCALNRLGAGGTIDKKRNGVYTQGRKISGNAQGRFGGAVMVNGSFIMDFDFALMDKVLKNPTANLIQGISAAKEGMITLREIRPDLCDMERVKSELKAGFEYALGVELMDGDISPDEIEKAQTLVEKYKRYEWTYRMDLKKKVHLST